MKMFAFTSVGKILLLFFILNENESFGTSEKMNQLVTNDCDPSSVIKHHEGYRVCVYLDTMGIKTIGIGYNLQRSEAKSDFAKAKANLTAIMSDEPTPVSQKCNCNRVHCLTDSQIMSLFQDDLGRAENDILRLVPKFYKMCCPVQIALVDMTFNLGAGTLGKFEVFLKYLTEYNWKAAGDDLELSKYCNAPKEPVGRCRENAGLIRNGCPCPKLTRYMCSDKSACCTRAQQCCKENVHFSSYKSATIEETVCKMIC